MRHPSKDKNQSREKPNSAKKERESWRSKGVKKEPRAGSKEVGLALGSRVIVCQRRAISIRRHASLPDVREDDKG